jgi:hypothetical protein
MNEVADITTKVSPGHAVDPDGVTMWQLRSNNASGFF